jgi:hypothetical protein
LKQIKGLQRRRYWPNFRLKIECNLKEGESNFTFCTIENQDNKIQSHICYSLPP